MQRVIFLNILNNTYKSSFIASVISLFMCIILLLLCAILVTYTNINEDLIPVMANASLYLSAFFGGFISAFKKNSGGLVRGLICGLCLCIFLCITAVFIPSFKLSLMFLVKLLLVSVFSIAGGILSVNISYKKHR